MAIVLVISQVSADTKITEDRETRKLEMERQRRKLISCLTLVRSLYSKEDVRHLKVLGCVAKYLRVCKESPNPVQRQTYEQDLS